MSDQKVKIFFYQYKLHSENFNFPNLNWDLSIIFYCLKLFLILKNLII